MVQAVFFSHKQALPARDLKAYYIPVVELLSNTSAWRTWQFARNPQASRLFYTSTSDLFAQEGIEAGRTQISCYKVMLNAQQIENLNQGKMVGKARLLALHFMPEDIVSCIQLSGIEHIEKRNPFYRATEVSAEQITPTQTMS